MGRNRKVDIKVKGKNKVAIAKARQAPLNVVKEAVRELANPKNLELDSDGNPYPEEIQAILAKPVYEIPRYKGDGVVQNRVTIINKRNILKMLVSTMGVLGTACTRLQIGRNTVTGWIKDDPEFAEIYDQVREFALDFAESSLFYLINQKDHLGVKFAATRYYLATKGKKRGYIESTHSIITDDQPIHIERTIVDPQEPITS